MQQLCINHVDSVASICINLLRFDMMIVLSLLNEILIHCVTGWPHPRRIDRFLGAFGVLSCLFLSIVLQSGARLLIHTLNYWIEQSVVLDRAVNWECV